MNKSTVILCTDRWTRAAANHGVPSTREPGKVPSQAQASPVPVADICSADLSGGFCGDLLIKYVLSDLTYYLCAQIANAPDALSIFQKGVQTLAINLGVKLQCFLQCKHQFPPSYWQR